MTEDLRYRGRNSGCWVGMLGRKSDDLGFSDGTGVPPFSCDLLATLSFGSAGQGPMGARPVVKGRQGLVFCVGLDSPHIAVEDVLLKGYS